MSEGRAGTFDSGVSSVEGAARAELRVKASTALTQLSSLRKGALEEQKARGRNSGMHPVDAAIATLDFINTKIGTIVNSTLIQTDKFVNLTPLFLKVMQTSNNEVLYNPVRGNVGYLGPQAESDAPDSPSNIGSWYSLTPEKIRLAWDTKEDRSLVRHLAGSRVGFIDKFIKEVKKATK